MGLLFAFLFALLLAETSSISVNQEVNRFKHPPLHLPLHHIRGRRPDSLQAASDNAPSFSEALALDDARVKFLSCRLTNKNLTAVTGSIDASSVTAPLNPGRRFGSGNYYIKVGLGTPPTYYQVVVDTGSSVSWVQCEPCARYCHPQAGSPFNPSASKTYQTLSCDTNQCSSLKIATGNSPKCTSTNICVYNATYADGSFSAGYLSKDSLCFGTEALPGFVFGCGQDNEGLFGQLAGLFGLAKHELSMISQLSTKYGKVFSYCLPTSTPSGETGSGGFLSIGTSSNSAPKFTPMLPGSLYSLKLSAISVSGKALSVAPSDFPTIIDSGTVISRLAMPVYSALRAELVKIISSKYEMAGTYSIFDACFAGSFDQISAIVPSVELIFGGGAELNLAPRNVIIQVGNRITCLSFAANSYGDFAIIGNQQQQTFEVVYDLARSKIGFAPGGCS